MVIIKKYQQTKTQMEAFSTISTLDKVAQANTYPTGRNSFDMFSIEQFLNDDAFVDTEHREQEKQQEQKQEIDKASLMDSNDKSVPETPTQKRTKSIFHNFQKHLITIFKKHFKITSRTFEKQKNGRLAFLLWQAFIKTKSYNKKILHIIFGMRETGQLQNQYLILGSQFKAFHPLANHYNLKALEDAQQMIRHEVIRQSRALNKRFLQANCNASRLQLLWEYFNSFLEQLAEGPISKRMSKEHKSSLIQKIIPHGVEC